MVEIFKKAISSLEMELGCGHLKINLPNSNYIIDRINGDRPVKFLENSAARLDLLDNT